MYELCQDRKAWFHLCFNGVEKISTSRQWNTCSANKQSELRTLTKLCVWKEILKTRRSDQTQTFLHDAAISKVYYHWSWIHPGHCHHSTSYNGQLQGSRCVCVHACMSRRESQTLGPQRPKFWHVLSQKFRTQLSVIKHL